MTVIVCVLSLLCYMYSSSILSILSASLAAVTPHLKEQDVLDYMQCKHHQMHKVTLKVPDEKELKETSEMLAENNISHKLWIEMPENIATCIATRPYPRSILRPLLKALKLFR
jgi:peptidyl-tRNA hydrolase PTRHD1